MTNEKYAQYVSGLVANDQTNKRFEHFLHAAVGLSGESGELLDKVKKAFWQGHPVDDVWFREAVLECGDILFYLQFMCNNLGVSLDEIRDQNVAKLSKRYKDNKFSTKASINRKD